MQLSCTSSIFEERRLIRPIIYLWLGLSLPYPNLRSRISSLLLGNSQKPAALPPAYLQHIQSIQPNKTSRCHHVHFHCDNPHE